MSANFFNAIRRSNVTSVQKLIDNGMDVNEQGYYNKTALIEATIYNNPDIVNLLLQNGANPDLQDDNGTTALISAVSTENLRIISLLLDAGANPNLQKINGETALSIIGRNFNPTIAEELYSHGAIDMPGKLTVRTIENYYLYASLVSELEKENYYILQQYTKHGDQIINALLRGADTIQTYRLHLYDIYREPWIQSVEQNNFFCLLLGELDPNGIKKFYTETPTDFYRFYKNTIYPEIFAKLEANDLTFFRYATYNVIKKFRRAIQDTRKNETVFQSYRGTTDFYLNTDSTALFKLSTFHSTSIQRATAAVFGRKMYIFNIHPDCVYMYMEPLTLFPGEYELLLAPGNRYAFLKEEGDTQIFAVLPPEKEYSLPDTYAEYMAYLQTSQSKNTMGNENLSRLNRSTVMSGGRKTRKHRHGRRGTRRTKIRKQRGGAGNQNGNSSENRWTDEVSSIDIEKRNAADKKMIQNMMRELA